MVLLQAPTDDNEVLWGIWQIFEFGNFHLIDHIF